MTEKKKSDCALCELVKKVGHESCAVLGKEMIQAFLEVMDKKIIEFQILAKEKLNAGEISQEEYLKLEYYASSSKADAATALAAEMAFEKPMLPPEVIVEMVRKKISEIAINILSSHQGSEKDALGLVLQSFGIKTDMRGGIR